MLLIQHPSNYRQSQATGAAGELARRKEVLKEHVCRVYMCKFGWLWKPPGWDTCFFGCCAQKGVPTAQAKPLFLLQDAPCWVQESPRHLAPGKGQLSTPSPKPTCGAQMHTGRVGNPCTCCTASCPDTGQGSFVHVVKTWLPIPALPGDCFGPWQ